MTIYKECRRYRPLNLTDRHFCQVQGAVIKECEENCPYNKPVQYVIKEGVTRFGKPFKIKIKVEED